MSNRRQLWLMVSLGAGLMLAGAAQAGQAYDGYCYTQKQQAGRRGAVAGAVVGGLVGGAMSDSRHKGVGALAGAVVGGLAGSGLASASVRCYNGDYYAYQDAGYSEAPPAPDGYEVVYFERRPEHRYYDRINPAIPPYPHGGYSHGGGMYDPERGSYSGAYRTYEDHRGYEDRRDRDMYEAYERDEAYGRSGYARPYDGPYVYDAGADAHAYSQASGYDTARPYQGPYGHYDADAAYSPPAQAYPAPPPVIYAPAAPVYAAPVYAAPVYAEAAPCCASGSAYGYVDGSASGGYYGSGYASSSYADSSTTYYRQSSATYVNGVQVDGYVTEGWRDAYGYWHVGSPPPSVFANPAYGNPPVIYGWCDSAGVWHERPRQR